MFPACMHACLVSLHACLSGESACLHVPCFPCLILFPACMFSGSVKYVKSVCDPVACCLVFGVRLVSHSVPLYQCHSVPLYQCYRL